jgi:membrane protease subunit (stomatin/prohibitin family)
MGMGFIGMNIAGQAGGMNAQNLFAMGQQQAPQTPATAAIGWTCTCGAVNKGKFFSECGKLKPAGIPQYKCDKAAGSRRKAQSRRNSAPNAEMCLTAAIL